MSSLFEKIWLILLISSLIALCTISTKYVLGLLDISIDRRILFIGLLFFCLLLFRYCLKLTFYCTSTRKLEGQTVIITGANSGIGREIALQVAQRGARVIMACRNQNTAINARDYIIDVTGNTNVVVKKLDLTSKTSIRKFAADIIANEAHLHILVHNAGIAIFDSNQFPRLRTENGLELTMATNHFGPFLLTHLLIDHMKKSALSSPKPGRIIIVTSDVYQIAARLNNTNLNPGLNYPFINYFISKYINICFTLQLAMRLRSCRITANCLHPGWANTPRWRHFPEPFTRLMSIFAKYFFKTVEQAAQTALYLICSDEVEQVTGLYFKECMPKSLNFGADNMDVAKAVWKNTLKYVKLRRTDPRI